MSINILYKSSYSPKSTIIKLFIVLFFYLLIIIPNGCEKQVRQRYEETYNFFKNPPPSYLPTVYWFWNGDIEYDRVKWQLDEMKRSNTVGSVCILAWEGLTTEYLSNEWFDKVKFACDIAEELDLEIWLYDEIRWPSGHAGGKVLESNPEYKAKCLARTEETVTGPQKISLPITSEPVVIIAGRITDEVIDESSLINVTSFYSENHFSWNIPEGDWSINIFSVEHCSFKPTFFDLEYVDLLNSRAVKKFLDLTHEQYYKRMPEYFGNVITAIITDEPGSYCNLKAFMINPETIPWTSSFFEEFELRKNYDLKKYLPAIWQKIGEKTAKIRIDFYDVFSDLLQQSYFKQLHDWCEDHNIKLNIQPVHEETMKFSTILQGDYFKAMEYSHLPGADEVYSWDKNLITPKIASSAARSYGIQDVYCEVFAAYGWDVTLEKMKAVTDWLFSRGINRLLLSSFYFAREGDWRMEIPPSLFYQNPTWQYLHNYTDYTKRLSYILSGGRNVSQIAVVYPFKNVQTELTPAEERSADKIDSLFVCLSNALLEHQHDFDYLNERTLINKTEVVTKNNKTFLRLDTKDFWVDYEVLILPCMRIIEESLLKKIKEFYLKGGKIIAFADLPQISPDGKNIVDDVKRIWSRPLDKNGNENEARAYFIKDDQDSLDNIVQNCLIPDVKLNSHQKDINYIHKVKNGLDIYFISNNDSIPVNTDISFSISGIPQIWNPEDGSMVAATEFRMEEDRTILPLQLDRYGSILVVFDRKKKEIPHIVKTNMKLENLEVRGDSVFVKALAIDDVENYITISWKGKEFDQTLAANLPEKIDIPDLWNFRPKDNSFPEEIRRSGSWTEKLEINQPDGSNTAPAHPYFSGTGIYSQKFCLDKSLFKNNRKFVLEPGQINDIIEVWLNGKKVGERCWNPFTFDITDYLKEGANDIQIKITNTPANNYVLKPQEYRFDEKWGKILPSGLIGKVKIGIYNAYEFVFIN